MDWFDSWALSLPVSLPLVRTAVVLAIPSAQDRLLKLAATLTTALTLLVGLGILLEFDYDAADKLQFQVDKSWIEVISSRYHVGIDGIALPLLILTMGITLLCVVYSWDHFPEPHNPKAF